MLSRIFASILIFALSGPAFAGELPPSIRLPLSNLNAMVDALPDLDEHDIALDLRIAYRDLYGLSMGDYPQRVIHDRGPQIIQDIFKFRMKLRSAIPGLVAQHKASPRVMARIQNIFFAARYAEDLVGEVVIGTKLRQVAKFPATAFTGGAINTLQPAGAPKIDFRSGDVILVRAGHYVSAAIARVTDIDSQFSHAGLVYVDSQKRKWVIEAVIEHGVQIRPLDAVLNDGVSRMILFRYHDPQFPDQSAKIASEAAEFMHRRLLKGPIEYDFTMSLNGYDKLFCSKVIRYAFDVATKGRVKLPMFPSALTMKNREFLDSLGIATKTTFAPGNLETDPRFDVVGEWRDYRYTTDLRIKDLILMKIFEWMNRYKMEFKAPAWLNVATSTLMFGIEHSNFVGSKLEKFTGKMPLATEKQTLKAVAMLQLTAAPLYAKLLKSELAFEQRQGLPMHPREMLEQLEKIRRDGHGSPIGSLAYPPGQESLAEKRPSLAD